MSVFHKPPGYTDFNTFALFKTSVWTLWFAVRETHFLRFVNKYRFLERGVTALYEEMQSMLTICQLKLFEVKSWRRCVDIEIVSHECNDVHILRRLSTDVIMFYVKRVTRLLLLSYGVTSNCQLLYTLYLQLQSHLHIFCLKRGFCSLHY